MSRVEVCLAARIEGTGTASRGLDGLSCNSYALSVVGLHMGYVGLRAFFAFREGSKCSRCNRLASLNLQ